MLVGPNARDGLDGVRACLRELAERPEATPRYRGGLDGVAVDARVVVLRQERPAVLIEASPTHAEVGIHADAAGDLGRAPIGRVRADLQLRRTGHRDPLSAVMEVVRVRPCLRGVRLSLKALSAASAPDARQLGRLLNTRMAVRVDAGSDGVVVPYRVAGTDRARFAVLRDLSVLGFGLALPASARDDLAPGQPIRFVVDVPGTGKKLRLAGTTTRITAVQPPGDAPGEARPFLHVGVQLAREHVENERTSELLGCWVVARQLEVRRLQALAG
jgi:hypothetical protein